MKRVITIPVYVYIMLTARFNAMYQYTIILKYRDTRRDFFHVPKAYSLQTTERRRIDRGFNFFTVLVGFQNKLCKSYRTRKLFLQLCVSVV